MCLQYINCVKFTYYQFLSIFLSNFKGSSTECDRKRRLNGIEQLESMYLLAPAGEMVFTPGVAFKFLTPGDSQNHISCPAPYDINCVGARL